MPQLDPTWYASQIFWLAVTFALLYLALAHVVLPPLMRVMQGREGKVSSDIAMAEQLKAQAEEAREVYERAMAEVRIKAQAVFSEAQANAKRDAEAANREMDASIAKKMAEAEARISAQKDTLLASLKPAVTDMTASIVQKLSGEMPDASAVSAALAQRGVRGNA